MPEQEVFGAVYLEINPRYEEVHDSLARVLYARGDSVDALAHWREGTNDASTLRQMAWVLAAYSDPSLRNGHEAIELAARALERSAVRGSALWDTLAAAYAEAGQFADAVLTAQRALRAAQQESRPDLVKAIQRRTRLYETEMPFREAPTVIH